ncbi:DUF2796 domain-containing protein [Thalassotalea euphylliae]|uniref:ZrgA family zinc uptake protein n=1 Tax=Thalassotalea euphylliae TaxID=1655234 RepID=UPI0036392D7A
MISNTFFTRSLLLLTLTTPVSADVAAQEQSAHVHGLAELMLAIEGEHIQIEILSPAESIVGFEHQASTPEEIAAYMHAKEQLSFAENVVQFSDGDCQLESVTVNAQGLAPKPEKQTHKHDHGNAHAHEHHHHAHGEKEKHHQEHVHHEHDEHHGAHAEINVSYDFHCHAIEKVSGASLTLFETFKGLEKISAMWVTEQKQGAATLTPTNSMLNLR